jgi:RNA-directed DNA polymerase
MLWKWCLRRHPNKGKYWVAKKFFSSHENVNWKFQATDGKQTVYLLDIASVRIERHTKVKGAASPDDPALKDYWVARQQQRTGRPRRRKVTNAPLKAGVDARAG